MDDSERSREDGVILETIVVGLFLGVILPPSSSVSSFLFSLSEQEARLFATVLLLLLPRTSDKGAKERKWEEEVRFKRGGKFGTRKTEKQERHLKNMQMHSQCW